jgi:PKD repeat protein
MRRKNIFLMILLLFPFPVFSQQNEDGLNQFIRSRTIDKNGKEIVGIIVPGRPPADGHREPVAIPTRSAVILSNVPAYSWSFGCSSTSAAMAAGYYDNTGYPDMYTGPTNAGIMPMTNSIWGTVNINGMTLNQCPLSASRNNLDGRTVNGHVDDYWITYNDAGPDPFIVNGWTEHAYGDCTGDYMGTSQSSVGNIDGGTNFFFFGEGSPLYDFTGCEPQERDGCHGMRDFFESRGYEVIQNYFQLIQGFNGNTNGFTFDQYKQEIDNGRPVYIQLYGHTMLGYGYDDAGNTVYLHDTWDNSPHTMIWGDYYGGMQHFAVTVVELGPATNIPTANFFANTTAGLPGSSFIFIDLSILNPTSWSWDFSPNTVTYLGGTSSTSQNPQVSFNNSGYYTVSLTATNSHGSDTETKTNYIHIYVPGMWAGNASSNWNTASNWDDGVVPSGTTNVSISSTAAHWPIFNGDFSVGTQCNNLTIPAGAHMTVAGNFTINAGKSLTFSGTGELDISGSWTRYGSFTPGAGTITFSGTNPSSVNYIGTISDITTYARSAYTKSFTHITDSITGPSGINNSINVPLVFTFNYCGTNYDSVRICTNGWISLNKSGASSTLNQDLFTTVAPNVTLAPWWDYLKDDGLSYVSYNTSGSSPNRIFTVEWHRVLTYYTGTSARITFQVKLVESTNIIEFQYGNYNSSTPNASEGASIGIEDATGGSGHFIEATTGSTTTGISTLKANLNWPAVNYRFSPPIVTENFNNLRISKSNNQVSFNCNVNVAGTFTVNPGATVKITFPRTISVNGY